MADHVHAEWDSVPHLLNPPLSCVCVGKRRLSWPAYAPPPVKIR